MLLLPLLACTPVPVDTGALLPPSVSLSGTVINASPGDEVGPAAVILYDAFDPPPPLGFGGPVDLATVATSSWSTPAPGAQEVAPWSMAGVPDGTWLLSALIDLDRDFSPFLDYTAGATCGDLVGGLADSASLQPLPLTVQAPAHVSDLTLLAPAALTTERPAFYLDPATPPIDQAAVTPVTPAAFTLYSTGVDHPLLTLNPPDAANCPSTFTVIVNDADRDGVADPHPTPEYAALGLLDVWPRVYLVALQGPDGLPVPEGETWVTEAGWYPLFMQDAAGGAVYQAPQITLLFLPAAQHLYPDGAAEAVYAPGLPAGYWAIVAVTPTGQIWSVPNQLADQPTADYLCSFEGLCAEPIASQGLPLVVQ